MLCHPSQSVVCACTLCPPSRELSLPCLHFAAFGFHFSVIAGSAHTTHMLSRRVSPAAAALHASSVFSVGPGVPDYSGTQIQVTSTCIDPSLLNLSPFLTFPAAFPRTHKRLSALCHHPMAFKTSMFTALVVLFTAFHAGEAVKSIECSSIAVAGFTYSIDSGNHDDNAKVSQRRIITFTAPSVLYI